MDLKKAPGISTDNVKEIDMDLKKAAGISTDKVKEIDMDMKKAPGTSTDDVNSVPRWLIVFDFVSTRLLAILVIAFWKATWVLSDDHFFPDDIYISISVSFALGPVVTLATMILQAPVIQMTSQMNFAVKQVFLRVYIYISAVSSVNSWRWLWYLADEVTGEGYPSVVSSVAIGVVGIVVTLRLVNTVACPGVVILDINEDIILKWTTFFKEEPGTMKHVGDCLFTVLVINSIALAAWRGLWDLIIMTIFPDDPLKNAWYSLLISIILGVLLLVTRIPMRRLSQLCETKHWCLKIVVEDVNMFLHLCSVVFMWSGEWILLDYYFLDPPLRFYVCHAGGFVGLVIALASTSIVTKGCAVDGDLPEGQGMLPDIRYITSLLLAYKTIKADNETLASEELQIKAKNSNPPRCSTSPSRPSPSEFP